MENSGIGTLKKEKDILYSEIADIWKEVEQLDTFRRCIEKWLQGNRELNTGQQVTVRDLLEL